MTHPNIEDYCINAFSTRALLTNYQAIAVVLLNSSIMICTLTANIMVVASLFGTKQLDLKINRMFLALTICDSVVASIVQPLIIFMLLVKREQRYCKLELAVQALALFSTHCSAFIVVAIGVERLLSIKASQVPQNATNISYKRPYSLLFICIVSAAAVSSSMTVCSNYGLFYVAQMILLILDFSALILVYSVYVEMYRSVARHVKETAFLRKNQSSNAAYAAEMVKAITLIIFFLFFSYVPYLVSGVIVFNMTFMQGSEVNDVHVFITYITYTFVYLNSFFNPAIVLHKNRKLFTYIKDKIRHTTKSFKLNKAVDNVDSLFKPISVRDVRPRI